MDMSRVHPRWGVEFDWLAIDLHQKVALFTSSGYGAVPRPVIDNVAIVDRAVLEMSSLPVIGEGVADRMPAEGDYSDWINASRRGLFAYDWSLWDGPYLRLTAPSVSIAHDQLSKQIREAAELVRLPFAFSEESVITVPYVDPA